MKIKKEDKPGDLRFYCSECFGATEAMQKNPEANLKCNRHPWRDVVVMREMIRPHGFPYYVSIQKKVRATS
jgi:hypothetical protein